jgi:3-hydroxybutyryl-CoA dehydratase
VNILDKKAYEDIHIGDQASFTKTVVEADIVLFAGVTGDFNPVHVDKEFAEKSFFKERIAHGMLSAGFISTVLGTKLPGPGTIYLGQTLQFKSPVKINDTITARVEVIEKIDAKRMLRLKTECYNQDAKLVTTGECTIMI